MKHSLLIIIVLLLQSFASYSQQNKPLWLCQIPESESFTYYIGMAPKGNSSQNKIARNDVIGQIAQNGPVAIETESTIYTKNTNANGTIITEEGFNNETKTKAVTVIPCIKEAARYDGDKNYFYLLMAVPKNGVSCDYSNWIIKESKSAFVLRSALIPGWGQFHDGTYCGGANSRKGQIIKGIVFFGAEAALISGFFISEQMRLDNINSAYSTSSNQAREAYFARATTLKNVRGACLIGAVGLYIYNVVDASTMTRKVQLFAKNDVILSPLFDTPGVQLRFSF